MHSNSEISNLTFHQLLTGYDSWLSSGKVPQSLLDHEDHEISVRGFLYKSTSLQGTEEWVLAAEPNLKSCCIGNKAKGGSQIGISGNLPLETSKNALTVQGKLLVNPQATHFYSLQQAFVTEDIICSLYDMTLIAGIAALTMSMILYCGVLKFFVLSAPKPRD